MRHTEPEHRTGFFHRAIWSIFLCPLIFFCLSCDIPFQKNEVEKMRSIEYILNGGTWCADYTAPKSYMTDRTVSLPTARNIEQPGCVFLGWYDNKLLSGSAISGWNAGENLTDVRLWAKWGCANDIPVADAARTIEELISHGFSYAVVLTGTLTDECIGNICATLKSGGQSDAAIMLDMRNCTGLEELPVKAFENCKILTSVVLPDSIKRIGSAAFSGCSNLASVGLPKSIKRIGDSAFSGCSNLTSVVLPLSLSHIGDSAFSGCTSLMSVALPLSLSYIGGSAFSGCSELTMVTILGSATDTGKYVFCNYDILMMMNFLAHKGASIEENVFSGCTKLEGVRIPDSLTDIKEFVVENYTKSNCQNKMDGIADDLKNKTTGAPDSLTNAVANAVKFATSGYRYKK